VTETHVEDFKKDVDSSIVIESQKHDIEVKTEELKQKLEFEKKKNDVLLETKRQEDITKIEEAKKKKADPEQSSNDLYGSNPDDEIKDAEEDLEKIKEQQEKEVQDIEEQGKQVEMAKEQENKARQVTVINQEHMRRWESESAENKVTLEHHTEYSINELIQYKARIKIS
jgi:hypothetical protein